VAKLANEAGVGQLILTHVSRRYRDDDILNEATAIFPNTFLAHDFDTFQVKHKD
jgi:ribonuclease Z